MDAAILSKIFQKHLDGTATREDRFALQEAVVSGDSEEELKEQILQAFVTADEWPKMDETSAQQILQVILETGKQEAKVIPLRKNQRWYKHVAAAVILAVLVSGVVFWTQYNKNVSKDIVALETKDIAAPTVTKAMITLADGRQVSVDSLQVMQLGAIALSKNKSGEIIYEGTSEKEQGTSFNTLYNPRGSKVVSLTLSDGSRVWLNAESSIKYPVAFNGSTREVEITGEGYFEVAKNKDKKFIVSSNGITTEVLGTHFNVHAYNDEPIAITLLEGSVNVKQQTQNRKLVPGEQASVNSIPNQTGIAVSNNIDVDEVMAWKNGLFQFNNLPIEDIMREAARWYDLDVLYKGKITQTFKGKIPRSVNISELFQILESTGWIHFTIEGKKITVTP